MFLSKSWLKRLKCYRILSSLGFFLTSNSHMYDYFTNYLFVKTKTKLVYDFNVLVSSFHSIIPIVLSIYTKEYCSLFIDLQKTNIFNLNAVYKLVFCSFSFVIYDWAYGIITNFFRIHLKEYCYKTNILPSIVFLLFLNEQERILCAEFRQKRFLTIGLTSISLKVYSDYPIFFKENYEYTTFFLKLLVTLVYASLW